jgi:hypothetical protein
MAIAIAVTITILGDNFYFIGNTGIYNLSDDQIVDRAKLESVHIAVVSVKNGIGYQNQPK